MLRCLGIDQRGAHDAGEGAYAVTDLAIRYLRPARLDDAVLVRSAVSDISPATCRIVQRAFREDALLSQATVRVAFVAPNGRPRRQPRAWVDAFHTVLVAPSEATSSEQEGPISA